MGLVLAALPSGGFVGGTDEDSWVVVFTCWDMEEDICGGIYGSMDKDILDVALTCSNMAENIWGEILMRIFGLWFSAAVYRGEDVWVAVLSFGGWVRIFGLRFLAARVYGWVYNQWMIFGAYEFKIFGLWFQLAGIWARIFRGICGSMDAYIWVCGFHLLGYP